MSNPYDFFGTNKELESGKGVTLEYPGFSITIHRAGGGNKKFSQVLAAKMRPHRQRFERGLLDDETSHKILLETYAESVVVGWNGVTDADGNPLEFNTANCIKLFTDLPDLFDDVKDQANKVSVFRQGNEEIEQKN